jgi:hypothetical protein
MAFPEDKSGSDAEYGTPEARAWMDRVIAASESSKLKRTLDDIVWTAMREDALQLTLPDGRQLMIGGGVADYGDEYADPWVYTDVIVTHPDGAIDILTYPKEIFPHLYWPVDAVLAGHVYIFGSTDRKRHPDRARRLVVLRLDTQTFEIVACPLPLPPVRLALYPGSAVRDGSRVILPLTRDREADPELGMAFDLETHTWEGPVPYPSSADD